MPNLKDSGYNLTSLENSLMEAEDIPTGNCHSTPSKKYKVQNIPYDKWLTKFKDILKGYFDLRKIEHKHFTKNINRFKTATRKWTKDHS